MKYSLSFDVSVNFNLTDTEFKLLDYAIKNCAETKYHAEHGGFWYGQTNCRKWLSKKKERENHMLSISYNNMDRVVCKALERYYSLDNYKPLYYKCMDILKEANEYCGILNRHQGELDTKS